MAIAHENDSRVACAHPPYEGQVLEAGDQIAGIQEVVEHSRLLSLRATSMCLAMLTPTFACMPRQLNAKTLILKFLFNNYSRETEITKTNLG